MDVVALDAETERQDRKRIAELMLVAIAVEVEAFLTDWIVASINRAPKAFQDDTVQRAANSIHSKWPWVPRKAVKLEQLPRLKVEALRETLTDGGFNLTFASHGDFLAGNMPRLGGQPRARLQRWNDHDTWLLDVVKYLRNYIAHANESALDRLNDCLLKVDGEGPHTDLGRASGSHKVRDVGKYLIASPGGTSRLARIEGAVQNTMAKLRL